MDKQPHRIRVWEQRQSLLVKAVSILLVTGTTLILLSLLYSVLGRSLSVAAASAFVGLIFVASGFAGALRLEKHEEDRRKRDVSRALSSDSSSVEYFEKLVNINVENLSAYYVTVKSHANKSFLTALFVGIVGFVIIGTGIALAVSGNQHGQSVTLLAGVSGVATEFISAVFFYLYSQTVRQMKEYHDSLLAVQNILLSFKLVGDTSDPTEKVKMIGVMLEYLVGKRSGQGPVGGHGPRQGPRTGADKSKPQDSAATDGAASS